MHDPLVPSDSDIRRRRMGTALVLAVFALGGLWLLGVVAADLAAYRAAAGWPSAPAELVSSGIEELPGAADGADGFEVVVRYRYEVDGRSYESNQLRREGAERFTSREAAEEALNGYLVGDRLRLPVRYDPADPATAVLNISPPGYLLLFVAFYWAILLVFLVPAVRGWLARRRGIG